MPRSNSTPRGSRDDGPAGLDDAPRLVRFAFTGTVELLRGLERARILLRRKHPAGRLGAIVSEAVELFLDKRDPERRLRRKEVLKRRASWRFAAEEGRRVPQWVKDEVWRRDGGRCVFRAQDGARCPEREGLEFDHVVPFALGGPSHHPGNIRLLCRGHNQMRARRSFG